MTKAKHILGNFPFFFLSIPLFIILHIEKQYDHLIVYKYVFGEILQLFIAPFIIFIISLFLLRQLYKSYIYSFILMFFFYFFADIKDKLSGISQDAFFSRYSFLLPLIILICITTFIWVKRKKDISKRLLLYINVLFLLFIAIDTAGIISNDIRQKATTKENNRLTGYTPCAGCFKPDIYYLIFDSYTSTEILRKKFHYDNNAMDSFLSQKGFRIIKNSRSNYNFTAYSIASCFNLSYLDGINTQIKIYSNEYLPLLHTVYNSKLMPMLEKEGYKIINQSVFDFNNHPSRVPEIDLWGFETLYQRYNIFKKINREIGWLIRARLGITSKQKPDTRYIDSRNKHDSIAIRALMATASLTDTQPRFIYTHIMLPHAPFIFDSSGHKVIATNETITPEKDKKNYVNQLVYTNSILKNVVTAIFEKNKRPFILIIQGDHGFKFFNEKIKEPEFGNLNAIYFYNKDYHMLYDSLSTVNTFRIVFNSFFKKNFPLLKDTSYFLHYK